MIDDAPTAHQLATFLTGDLGGLDQHIEGLRPLSDAASGHLSFVSDPAASARELSEALELGAIVLVPRRLTEPAPLRGTTIAVDSPRAAFAAAVTQFFAPRPEAGIASSAIVHPTAQVSASAVVGEFTVIGAGVTIGDGTEIRHHCVIGRNVQIGDHCLVKSNAVIGEEGFGLEKDESGNNIRIPHLGSVRVGDHVEIGSFTSINAGTITPTVIDDYVKISDNVHIAHNCRVGTNSILTGSVELSGSVSVGANVWIAPHASVREKLTIGDGATVGIGAVVVRSIVAGEVHYGNPARRAP